jgi:hypothetical protein
MIPQACGSQSGKKNFHTLTQIWNPPPPVCLKPIRGQGPGDKAEETLFFFSTWKKEVGYTTTHTTTQQLVTTTHTRLCKWILTSYYDVILWLVRVCCCPVVYTVFLLYTLVLFFLF